MPEHVRVAITPDQGVTAIIYLAAMRDQADVTLILAHGAGAGRRRNSTLRSFLFG